MLPKAGVFLWLVFHKRCITMDRLKRLGVVGPTRCVMCEQAEEEVDHLFLSCPIATKCWDWLQK